MSTANKVQMVPAESYKIKGQVSNYRNLNNLAEYTVKILIIVDKKSSKSLGQFENKQSNCK
jgi:hypothetical protein